MVLNYRIIQWQLSSIVSSILMKGGFSDERQTHHWTLLAAQRTGHPAFRLTLRRLFLHHRPQHSEESPGFRGMCQRHLGSHLEFHSAPTPTTVKGFLRKNHTKSVFRSLQSPHRRETRWWRNWTSAGRAGRLPELRKRRGISCYLLWISWCYQPFSQRPSGTGLQYLFTQILFCRIR